MSKSLKDVIVLDLGQIYNGSYCSMLMAYQGAEVIKIEPLHGEVLRKRTPTDNEPHEFKMLNSNKKSVSLNLKSEEGKALFIELLKNADVLIENFAKGVMEKLGLSYEELSKINPRLVFASGKGYGSDGPYSDLPAMDLTVQAMGGVMAATGFPDAPPIKAGAAVADFMGGIHLYAGIMTALYQRERLGKGQYVEVSMHDTMYPLLASPIGAYYNFEGTIPERTGNRHSGLAQAPYNVYPTKDGYVAIFCVTEKHWGNLVNCIGISDIIDDPRFQSNKERVKNMEDTDKVVSTWTEQHDKETVINKLLEVHVPCAPVQSIKEIVDDPHLKHRGMIREVEYPNGKVVKVPGSPINLSESPLEDVFPSPLLGQHTGQILKKFTNINEADIESLKKKGVIK